MQWGNPYVFEGMITKKKRFAFLPINIRTRYYWLEWYHEILIYSDGTFQSAGVEDIQNPQYRMGRINFPYLKFHYPTAKKYNEYFKIRE